MNSKNIFTKKYIYDIIGLYAWKNYFSWSDGRVAEGGTLLRCYVGQPASRVQIPVTPNDSPMTFMVIGLSFLIEGF